MLDFEDEGTTPLQNCSPDRQCHIPAHLNLHQNCCEDVTSYHVSYSCVQPCRGVWKVQNLFLFSDLVMSRRNYKIPTWSKCETYTSSCLTCGIYSWLYDQFGFVTL